MTGTHSGSGLGDSIRKGVGMIHGTGEAIRGNAMSMVDEATGDKSSAAKNQAIADKGVNEWDQGYRGHATSAGVTPADTDRERMNTTNTTSTNYGSHNSNIGNKIDPRYDSDMDHRGTATGSANHGPHSTNVSNKLDPRVDSDADHRSHPTSTVGAHLRSSYITTQTDGVDEEDPIWDPSSEGPYKAHEYQHGPNPPHEHRGSITDTPSLKPANKLDPIFHAGPDEESMKYTDHPDIHRLRGSISGASGLAAAQKLDPPEKVLARVPDEVKTRGPGYAQPDPIYHQPKPAHKNSVLNMLDPDASSEQHPLRNRAAKEYEVSHKNTSHSEPTRYSPDTDDDLEPQSRRRSRKSEFL
ncbi:hypothetical protein PtrSN002B_005700 [Pyrenophora tritici-repentis]|nr:hypothetical protein Alg130_06131 [Pyrenophora tritici-repentis]KAI0604936.1 hypothetical protein TUN205_10813 [Pyrenophora tritici-repentis]KAI1534570.1 hypothetical protein PtrSN001C_007202 [Pyrenophora tritici-repentis]KAI1551200.1 hypothetical protein PtrSN002B_005700 [Pyrenophora tritici-repentis]KAI1566469.1 hypothetical protein PtrEW4_007618 [Pyrenophora tritici-repentis]